MDLLLARRRRWLLLLAAAGVSGYGVYRLYYLPAIAEKRWKLTRFFCSLVSVAEAFSSSAETVTLVSDDLNRFLRADSDEIPRSLRQISKIARSDEFATSVSRISEAMTIGVLRGFTKAETGVSSGPSFSERAIDKLFSPVGSGFASVVVGSFARSLVMGFFSAQEQGSLGESSDLAETVPGWVHLICDDKCRHLIGDSIQLFVSTAVSVYLDKTMDINTYDEIFSGLTNPKHESKVKEILVSVCSGAVETLVKTSHEVLASPRASASTTDREEDVQQKEKLPLQSTRGSSFADASVREAGGWVGMVSSTLSVPSNRSLVLDLTGRITFETVRSFLEFMLWKLFDGAKRGAKFIRGEIVERGLEVMRYMTAKSMVAITVCFALCLHILSGTRMLVPA